MSQFKYLIIIVFSFFMLLSCSGVNNDQAGGEDFPNTISEIGEKLALFTKTQDSTPQNPQYEVSASKEARLSRLNKTTELNPLRKIEKTTEISTIDDSTSSIVSRYSGDTLGYDSLLVNTVTLMDNQEGNEIVHAYYSSRYLGVDSSFHASIDLDGDNRILPAVDKQDKILYLSEVYSPSFIEKKWIKISPGPSLNYDIETDNVFFSIETLNQSVGGDTLLWEMGLASDTINGINFSTGGELIFQRLEVTNLYRKNEIVEGFHHQNQEMIDFKSSLSRTDYVNGRVLIESSKRLGEVVVAKRLRALETEGQLLDTLSYSSWSFKLIGQDTIIQSFELYRSEIKEWSEVKVNYDFDQERLGYATIKVVWKGESNAEWSLNGEYTPQGYSAEITSPEGRFSNRWDLLGQEL